MFDNIISINIGVTNSYVSINGNTVANSDGTRYTPSMANTANEAGLTAQQKWVRQPDANYSKNDKKFWHILLTDLKTTAQSNCKCQMNEAFIVFILDHRFNLILVENEIKNIFNKNHFILTRPEMLLVDSIEGLMEKSKQGPKDGPKEVSKEESKYTNIITIIDIGGSKCKVTLISYNTNTKMYEILQETALNFGGQDFANKISDLVISDFKRKNRFPKGEDLNERSKRKIFIAARNAMHTLSNTMQSNLHVDSIWEGIDLNMGINVGRFNDLISPYLNQLYEVLNQNCLTFQNFTKDSKNSSKNQIFLIGGCSRIPFVKAYCSKFSNIVETLDFEETLSNIASKIRDSETGFYSKFLNFLMSDRKNMGNVLNDFRTGRISCRTTSCGILLNEQTLLQKNSPTPIAVSGKIIKTNKTGENYKNYKIIAENIGDLTEKFELIDDTNPVETLENQENISNIQYFLSYDVEGKCKIDIYKNEEMLHEFCF